ncbi:maleylpyruvate isomerase family mycothiol-dependent enzyme [Streptomyces sp. RB6PN25]|uniref:Maleylpyruvate isomerase family mycothiol-dependent enzyme n=1 Tax=Streptomyces humicola TaxID=2953240 RepID=A0ABT1PWU7_9ACTN|nr:maleylpyruvate isomerase family mycothiol-dependent enzyme [Streptomyces humicola]MCQ4082137.1 maleylpyruvate isomerase family mycothiol-dependent enzyme [Streptomyces humicola]
MAGLDHETYCSHIVAETEGFREALRGADLETTVPTCPEWTLWRLAQHLGGGNLWAEEIVRSRSTEALPFADVPGLQTPQDPEGLDAWLADGAERLVATLREAGPDASVWTFTAHGTSGFWARRRACETLVHRADAALAAGREYQAPAELAADAIDEWLEIVSSPEAIAFRPSLGELSGKGETLHLHATDAPPELGAEWLIERTPDGVRWRREHAKGDVALRGTLTDVLLVFNRRLPLDSERLDVIGDRSLLDHWLERTNF